MNVPTPFVNIPQLHPTVCLRSISHFLFLYLFTDGDVNCNQFQFHYLHNVLYDGGKLEKGANMEIIFKVSRV